MERNKIKERFKVRDDWIEKTNEDNKDKREERWTMTWYDAWKTIVSNFLVVKEFNLIKFSKYL